MLSHHINFCRKISNSSTQNRPASSKWVTGGSYPAGFAELIPLTNCHPTAPEQTCGGVDADAQIKRCALRLDQEQQNHFLKSSSGTLDQSQSVYGLGMCVCVTALVRKVLSSVNHSERAKCYSFRDVRLLGSALLIPCGNKKRTGGMCERFESCAFRMP